MTKEFRRWVSIRITDQTSEESPPDSFEQAINIDPSVGSEKEFATCLASTIIGMRAGQDVCGNGAWTGGDDTAEMAAHFAAIIVNQSLSNGFWHFPGGDTEAELDGFGELLRAVRQLLHAANEVIRLNKEEREQR